MSLLYLGVGVDFAPVKFLPFSKYVYVNTTPLQSFVDEDDYDRYDRSIGDLKEEASNLGLTLKKRKRDLLVFKGKGKTIYYYCNVDLLNVCGKTLKRRMWECTAVYFNGFSYRMLPELTGAKILMYERFMCMDIKDIEYWMKSGMSITMTQFIDCVLSSDSD